jgi:hypothetical protein
MLFLGIFWTTIQETAAVSSPVSAPAHPPAPQTFHSPAQAAGLLGVCIDTIWNYCKDPRAAFPHYRLKGKTIRIDKDELLAWLACRKWLGRIRAGEHAEGVGPVTAVNE